MPAAAPPPSSSLSERVRHWLRALRPAAQPLDGRERLRVVLGAGLGLLLTALLSEWLLPHRPGLPWLVAPLGASAVLGGNTLSALVAALSRSA
ncbi:hypothetical protein G8A07_00900 [Roseateles sp. DAIF2]|uniref:HPP family protein n=1 Tax=Roseateles sp. DAIF2 TaxID=2714952 RepID=UPI0018A33686|nr:hypothetical protein G8A07_00900 [Roseateles sp. DAIF2]